jgi:hypothetical protein
MTKHLGRSVDLIVCTRLDKLNDIGIQRDRDIQSRKEIISAAFGVNENQVIVCTPSHYLGAQILLNRCTPDAKPDIDFRDPRFSLEISVSLI